VPREPSKPDLEVSAALATRGLDVPSRTLERMREWGLLLTRNQHGIGSGSVAEIATDEVDRATFAHELLTRHGSYARATLAMSVDGRYPIPKDRLEKAYTESLAGVQRHINRPARGAQDEWAGAVAVAEWLAVQVCKRRKFRTLRKRLRTNPPSGMTVRWALECAATDMFLLLARGRAASPQGLRDMLTITGVADVLTDPATGQPTEPLDTTILEELSPYLSLTALNTTVRSSTLDELERARDFAKTLRSFAATYGVVLKRTYGIRAGFIWLFSGATSDMAIAYATPALAVLLRKHPEPTQRWLELMTHWTPIFAENISNSPAKMT